MSLPLVFRPEVQPEVQEAYNWYEARRDGLGEEFLASVDEALERIGEAPETYAILYRDVRVVMTRRFPYGVYYQIEPEQVLIVAIMHAHRDPRRWQGRV